MTQPAGIGRLEFVNESGVLNGGGINGGSGSFRLVKGGGMKRAAMDAGLDDLADCGVDDSDSDSDNNLNPHSSSSSSQHGNNPNNNNMGGLKPGKKTKGRVKIKMEFIENKLRRYTTFSKRKTGIMKKAYELSTLTGTQVMLLVASETGHVYTFATRKLQPMITSDSGKGLIQTCLNSPDPAPTGPGQQQAVEQRMNPTGFEETELSYAVGDEDQPKMAVEGMLPTKSTSGGFCQVQPPSPSPSPVSASPSPASSTSSTQPPPINTPPTIAMTTYIAPTSTSTTKPSLGGMTLLASESQNIVNYMQSLQTPTPITIPVTQMSSSGQPAQQPHQAIYRFPTPQPGQVVSLQGVAQNLVKVTEAASLQQSSSTQLQATTAQPQPPQPQNVTMIQGGTAATTGMMYQTPQGLVYAAPPGALGAGLPEGLILNLQQSQALQLQEQAAGGQQQYITIPVPLSATQMFPQMLSQTPTTTSTTDIQRSTPDPRPGNKR